MDRDEALKLLQGGHKGTAEWDRRREHGEEIPELNSVVLNWANLSGANLRGANLEKAQLMGANFYLAKLSGANLIRASLDGTNLVAASLEGADLQGASLSAANLFRADLSGADLRGAWLVGANLNGASLGGAKLAEATFGETVIAAELFEAIGLEEVKHEFPSVVDVNSVLSFKGDLPEKFLRGCGFRNEEIEYFRSVVGSPIRFYSCFISYSHENRAFARRLHDALQSEGIRCWLDEHQLLPGDEVHEVVNKAIRHWDKVLLCCSKDSLTSWWVDNEISSAFHKEQRLMKERGEKVLALIPLDLDGYVFSGWQSGKRETVLQRLVGDFKGWDKDKAKFEGEFQKLLKALRADEGARENPPPSQL